MRTLKILLRKEFQQIFRNKLILAITTIIPIMQFLILPLAANFEIKSMNIVVVDHDHSTYSRQLLSKITGSGYFRLIDYNNNYNSAYKFIETDDADVILEIPSGFEKNLVRQGKQSLLIAINAINSIKAGLGATYLNSIIADFNQDILLELIPANNAQVGGLEIVQLDWFNPNRNYQLSLIPGILAMLVTMVGSFLTALNIVKEKELGTIEQINVSPIKKRDFILAKLIPFWILANVVFTIGLILSYLIYDIVPRGNLLVLYVFIAVYLLAVLGFGLLVSTYCQTQQQAMFIMFFFIMIFLLLGGLFTPIDSMPRLAQWFTKLNPVAYLIEVIRMVMLKGSGLKDILPQLGSIALMAIILNGWAVFNYKKTT
jgi:ABC-2 type transport system permease protein